jgi:ATP-dependent DNA ligase
VSGTRTKDWLKLKNKVTFDLVVLGLYQTPERVRDGWPCSNLLGGVLNTATGKLETLAKITTPSRAVAEGVYHRLAKNGCLAYTWSENRPYYWQNERGSVHQDPAVVYAPSLLAKGGSMLKKLPSLYVRDPMKNSLVIEACCLSLSTGEDNWQSCGLGSGGPYTMRQPVFARFRDDKKTTQATTAQQVLVYAGG